MKTPRSVAAAAVLAAAALAPMAHADLSANIGVTTDYIWRGISQSGGSASVSGGVDYTSDKGFYAGTWVGSLSEGAGSEVDLYLGYGAEAGKFSYDLGYIYYAYPSISPGVNFGEVYGSLGYGAFTVGLHYTVQNDSANDDVGFESGDIYFYTGFSGDLSDGWSYGLSLGSYSYDADSANNEIDYLHYGVDLGKSTEMGDFMLTVSDTDLDGSGGDADPRVVVSWGLEF